MPRQKIEDKFFEMTDGHPELVDEVLKRQKLMDTKEVAEIIKNIKEQLEKIFKTKLIEDSIDTKTNFKDKEKQIKITSTLPKVDLLKKYDFAKNRKDSFEIEVIYSGKLCFNEKEDENDIKPLFEHELKLYPINTYIDISEKLYEIFQYNEEKLQEIQELDADYKKISFSIKIPIDEKDNLLIDDIEIFMEDDIPRRVQKIFEDDEQYDELIEWIHSKEKDRIKNLIKGYKDRPEPNFRIKPGGVYANMKKEIDKEAAKANEINNTTLYEYFTNSENKSLEDLESIKKRIETFEDEIKNKILKDQDLELVNEDNAVNILLPDGSIKFEKDYFIYDEDKDSYAHIRYSLLAKLSDPKETGKPQEVQKIYEAAVMTLKDSFEDFNDDPENNNQAFCIPLKDAEKDIFDFDNAFKKEINFSFSSQLEELDEEEKEKFDIIPEFREQIEKDLGLITEPENKQEKNQENQNNKISSPNL